MRFVLALILFPLLVVGCSPVSDLSGSYAGEVECGEDVYDVELALNVTENNFVYSGGLLFQYTETLFMSGDEVELTANFLYDIQATQPVRAGAQDIYFNVTWEDIGCERAYPDENNEIGRDVCEQEGIDLSILGDEVGDVIWRFDGGKRLSIDDDSCEGSVER